MKKVFALLLVAGVLFSSTAYAQSEASATEMESSTESAEEGVASSEEGTAADSTESMSTEENAETAPQNEAKEEAPEDFTQVLKKQFIDGGPFFMSIVLLALILGLALVIERIIYLSMSTTNNERLLAKVEDALNEGGIDAAKEVCRNSRGPVASIFYNGLDKADEGIEMVDKAIVSVGSVENGKLERGVSWISLFIALAPMLGFMGTVIGMIDAFDAIEAAGDISPSLVAGGIKVALLTTVFGLITAMILQIFYNLIIAMIDNIVNKMEDASIAFLDLIAAYQQKGKK
jgi:biopolymer transport protein ExbB